MNRTHQYARLRERIGRSYAIVTDRIKLPGLSFDFVKVAEPDRVLDQVAAAEDVRERLAGTRNEEPLHLPYWAELWDSAIAMASRIARHRDQFVGKAVLDLGCGQGLSGVAAAYAGAEVTFADLEAPALLFARLNGLPSGRRVHTRRLNWQHDQLRQKFDRIIGADILYERSQWTFLDTFWRAHLRPGGDIWLGEPGRPSGDGFLSYAGPAGWSVVRHDDKVSTRVEPVRILELCLLDSSPVAQASAGRRSV